MAYSEEYSGAHAAPSKPDGGCLYATHGGRSNRREGGSGIHELVASFMNVNIRLTHVCIQ